MASACSLGNLSNLESCQDTERLCTALPHPLPCVSALAHEWTRGRKSRKEWRGKQTERGCQCSLFLIQGKLTLCVDRTSNHLLGFCCPPQGFGSGGFAPSSLLSHNSPTLDPLFSQLLSVNVRAPFLCQICTDSCGTASFWGASDTFNLTRLADMSSSGGSRGQEEVW